MAVEQRIWSAVVERLDKGLPDWRSRLERFGQVRAAQIRAAGGRLTDAEVLSALLQSILSNSTDWAKVERVLPHLSEVIGDLSLTSFASLSDDDIRKRVVPWFIANKAGSMVLRRSLLGLRDAASRLEDWSAKHGSAESFFLMAGAAFGNDYRKAAMAIGTADSEWKLPSLGPALAAESLRNMGFAICKPDRHICRAAGSWRLVNYRKWPDRTRYQAPLPGPQELLETMEALQSFAEAVGENVCIVDNAVWLICAQSGLHMTNEELRTLTG